MIKWMICLFLGHYLNDNKKYNITTTDIVGITRNTGLIMFCERCKKYKTVFRV